MNKIRKNVIEIMKQLEKLSENDYRTFELALALFLRSDIYTVESIEDKDLEYLDKIIYDSEYFMSDSLKEEIDNILEEVADYE